MLLLGFDSLSLLLFVIPPKPFPFAFVRANSATAFSSAAFFFVGSLQLNCLQFLLCFKLSPPVSPLFSAPSIHMHERYTCFLWNVPVFLISARDSLFSTKDEDFMCYTIYIHLSHPLPGIHTKETAQTLVVSQLANCFAFTDGYMANAFVPNVFIQQIIFHCNVCAC